MRFDHEALPELRKPRDTAARKNETFEVMAALIARSPMPEAEWRARYEDAYLERAWKDETVRALVASGRGTPSALAALQELLDASD
jgi:hypothetical protein